MDKIFEGTLRSNKPDALKKELIKRVLQAGSSVHPVTQVKNMLDTCLTMIVRDQSEFAVASAKSVYFEWAKYNKNTLEEFFSSQTLRNLLSEQVPNPAEAVWVVHKSLALLRVSRSRFLPQYMQIVEMASISFVRENSQFEVVDAYCRFLLEFRECIPKGDYTSTFCTSLIGATSFFAAPTSEQGMRFYVREVSGVIGGLLKHTWLNTDRSCIMKCLQFIFQVISHIDPQDASLEPSLALGGIVQHIPMDCVDTAVKRTVSDNSIADQNMAAALSRMIDWLSWPGAQNLDVWITAFLRGLAAVHKYTILIEVTDMKIEQVYEKLRYPVVRESAFAVLCHMLLSFQHSPEPFHKIVGQVPETVHSLLKDRTEASYRFLCQLAELMHCLMHLHMGFPDLYEPLLDSLQTLPRPTLETIRARLKQSCWTALQASPSAGAATYSSWQRKSETGMTGLVNLGNTCYMNSVLQGLYMCDSFRKEVLALLPGPRENLLLKLQNAFAFLSFTQRAAYSPQAFLAASRPPWFTAGAQQDCSEFMRHFLDQLHEQERTGQRRDLALSDSSSSSSSTSSKSGKFTLKFKSSKSSSKSSKSSAGADAAESAVGHTLVQRTFGGTVQNTYRCLNCGAQSSHNESFTDLPLAFPSAAAEPRGSTRSSAPKLVGGDASSQQESAGRNGQKHGVETLALEDLLESYLKPERLDGENRYHCDRCKGLQDGERTMQITESPEYLILTLLRFAYDIKTQSRSKIFMDVRYPKSLALPVRSQTVMSSSHLRSPVSTTKRSKSSTKSSPPASPGSASPSGPSTGDERLDTYALSSVIVHSGYSSDGGHYYCYARHSVPTASSDQRATGSPHRGSDADTDYLQDRWYQFNDSRVSYSAYDNFSNVTRKFAKDTAYVLVYRKVAEIPPSSRPPLDPNESLLPALMDPPLRKELRELVDKDNTLYLQEREIQERTRAARRQSSSAASSSSWYNWKDDENGPPGSCGGGGGMSFGGSRLVF